MKLALSPGSLYVLLSGIRQLVVISLWWRNTQGNDDAVLSVLGLEIREVLGVELRGLGVLVVWAAMSLELPSIWQQMTYRFAPLWMVIRRGEAAGMCCDVLSMGPPSVT